MEYRLDPDLEFLGKLSSADLDGLVRTLTHDKDGEPRFTETLTKTAAYQRNPGDHAKYWEQAAAEIQSFGANSIVTLFRGGKGVLYAEILGDVCDKLKVKYAKGEPVSEIERKLLSKVLEDVLNRMSQEEIRQLAEEAGVSNWQALTKDALTALLLAAFRAGGFKSYQLLLVLANAVLKALIGRGLSFAGNAMLTRTAAVVTGPAGWVVAGMWTAFDIASPAYRVTIPAVIQIIALREKLQFDALPAPALSIE